MWFNILPAYVIIVASVGLPGYGLWWLHYLFNGNILPTFFIITAGLGLPGWGLYHVHNLVLGNHYRRGLIDRWERSQYQRDIRLTGDAYKPNGLEIIPDFIPNAADKSKRVTIDGKPYPPED